MKLTLSELNQLVTLATNDPQVMQTIQTFVHDYAVRKQQHQPERPLDFVCYRMRAIGECDREGSECPEVVCHFRARTVKPQGAMPTANTVTRYKGLLIFRNADGTYRAEHPNHNFYKGGQCETLEQAKKYIDRCIQKFAG